MEFLVNRHPCAVAGVMVVASIIIRILGMAAGLWGLALMGDIVFVLALLAGTAGIILRRRERRKIIGYCEKCGQSYKSEYESRVHAGSHELYQQPGQH